jgi:hypothetical protein
MSFSGYMGKDMTLIPFNLYEEGLTSPGPMREQIDQRTFTPAYLRLLEGGTLTARTAIGWESDR